MAPTPTGVTPYLTVSDANAASAFYQRAFGMRERFSDGPIVFMTTPDGGDSLALHLARSDDEKARVGQLGGCEHFGIHLADRSAASIDDAADRVRAAGGQVLERGEHAPGVAYAYVADPDGYAIEI